MTFFEAGKEKPVRRTVKVRVHRIVRRRVNRSKTR
jgi:hypothetical protein